MRRRIPLAAVLAWTLVAASTTLAAGADRGRPGSSDRGDRSGTSLWFPFASSCGSGAKTGSQGAVQGPATPPAGTGSYRFEIGSNGDTYRTLRSRLLTGKRLTDLTTLTYWTYVSAFGSGGQAPYIDLRVDLNGNGTADDTLTFEPIYQTGTYSGDTVPNQGTVALNTWQSWNAVAGGWWSENAGNSGPPLVTLAHYATDHSGARIVAIRLAAGCGGAAWANFVGYVDKVTIGVDGMSRTFDFEPGTGPNRQSQKVTICHKGHTIKVDRHAVPAHRRHGDTLGPCGEQEKKHEKKQGQDDEEKEHDG
jgi:hypothetical protein